MGKVLLIYFLFIPIAIANPISNISYTNNSCSNNELIIEMKKVLEQSTPALKYLGEVPTYAGTSCQQIYEMRPEANSGYYWIQGHLGPSRVYCQMEGESCGEGAWMRVANVNMTKPSASCPNGLEKIISPKLLCRRNVNVGCSSVKFSTFDVPFTKVCGKVIGYQYNSPDAFYPYFHHQTRTIDDLYVDGISITHSSHPRQHIWTFAAALHEAPDIGYTKYSCPCCYTGSGVPFRGLIPEFIGDDYYCETGSRTTFSNRYYLEDPLWDGRGCGRFSSCCRGNQPWFVKHVDNPVVSDLELRLCCLNGRDSEDVLLEIINLFVQN